MALLARVTAAARAAREILLGISGYEDRELAAQNLGLELDDPDVIEARKRWGGNIVAPPMSQTRWLLSDVESATHAADTGKLMQAGRLMAEARSDGHFAGLLSTRTGGLVRLPRKFIGDQEVVRSLEPGHDDVRSVFDEMLPPSELALLAGDGVLCGVGVGELIPVPARGYPVLVRYDPQFLEYVWTENQWYFRSNTYRLPITPGDGRWVLHTPGGRVSPWKAGAWRAIGKAYVRKTQAQYAKDNWESKLANPARVATAAQGATEKQRDNFFRQVMAWGFNTVFDLPPGWQVTLLESNGRGWESFDKTIDAQNTEMTLTLCGQTVTVDGGAGFQNSDIHKTIRADLIQETADSLAYTVNTQCLPHYVRERWGEDAILRKRVVMGWDVTPPKDRNSEASSMVQVAAAIDKLGGALRPHGVELDVDKMCERYAVPVITPEAPELDEAGKPKLRVIEGGGGSAEGDTITPIDSTPGEGAAQDSALNGAQVTSLMEIVQNVANGTLPRDAAIGIIKRAFCVDDDAANEMLGSAGTSFVPKPPPTAAPAPDAQPKEAAA